MLQVKEYTDPLSLQSVPIHYKTDVATSTHYVFLKDILTALGYAYNTIRTGLFTIGRRISDKFKTIEYIELDDPACADTSNPHVKIKQTILLNYSGCLQLLQQTRFGNTAFMRKWLHENIFTSKESRKLIKVEDKQEQDKRSKDYLRENDSTIIWKFNDHTIRSLNINNTLYIWAIDVSLIFDYPNPRPIINRYIDSKDRYTIYRGKKPITVLTIQGILDLLNHITKKTLVAHFKDWFLNVALLAYQKGLKVPDFNNPKVEAGNKILSVIRSNKENHSSNQKTLDGLQVSIEQYPLVPNIFEYKENKIRVITLQNVLYFILSDILNVLNLSLDEVKKLVPAYCLSNQLIVDGYTGNKAHSKTCVGCLTCIGLMSLLEHTNNQVFQNWFIDTLLPKLVEENDYIPIDFYDMDLHEFNESIDMVSVTMSKDSAFLSIINLDKGLFNCSINDVDIPILVNQTGIWFGLTNIEQALEYPAYVTQGAVLKVIDFSIVDANYVCKIQNLKSKSRWTPYYIEYEGLKCFLASCEKPNAEELYLCLEEYMIPFVKDAIHKRQLELKEDTSKLLSTSNDESQQPQPAIDVSTLLANPDLYIKMLTEYKAKNNLVG